MTKQEREEKAQEMAIESGRRLKEARLERGLTLAELGEKMGLTGAAIGNYESGARRFGDAEALALVEIFGLCEAYWLALVDRREAEMLAAGRRAEAELGRDKRDKIEQAIRVLERLQA